jgi:hypothetical protein
MMADDEREVQHFLEHWFAGLMSGLENLDRPDREAVLRHCGQACADSYTAELFRTARAQSSDMEAFTARLAECFPQANYELLAADTLRVRYRACACDLVRLGLVRSPLLCTCSSYNLQANLERALGLPVSVRLEASILQGADQCSFLVSLAAPGETPPLPDRRL